LWLKAAKVSAKDVTQKAIYERLVLVPGPRRFASSFAMPYATTSLLLTVQQFVDFAVFSFEEPLQNLIYLEPV